MSTRLVLRVCMVVGTVFLTAAGSYGQILNPRVTLTAASSSVSAVRNFVVDGDTFKTQYAGGGRGKARLTLDLTKHLSLEGVYGFGTSNLTVTKMTATPQTNAFGVREHELQVNILHFFTGSSSHFRPFLTTGIGDAHFGPTDAAKAKAAVQFIDDPAQISSTNKVSFTLGGGLEARSSHRIGLRLDLTDHISGIPTYGVPQTAAAPGSAFYPVNGTVHNIQLEAGLVFYLWRLE